MPMVDIRKMCMNVPEPRVLVRVCVRFRVVPCKAVHVLVMFVVRMVVRVLHRLVQVVVPVALRQM